MVYIEYAEMISKYYLDRFILQDPYNGYRPYYYKLEIVLEQCLETHLLPPASHGQDKDGCLLGQPRAEQEEACAFCALRLAKASVQAPIRYANVKLELILPSNRGERRTSGTD